MLRGTLERVPRTPQNFSQILYWRGWGGGAERGLAPGGGCAPGVAGSAGVSGTRRGACLLCRLLPLPLAFFPAPIPPPALAERSSRREWGEYYFISPGAIAPGTPGIKPPAALTEPAKQVPRGQTPRGTGKWGRTTRPAGGVPSASPVWRKTDRKRFPTSSAASQGEGGPGERNFGV